MMSRSQMRRINIQQGREPNDGLETMTDDRSAQWIRADERLPETDDQDYLVVVSGKIENVTLLNAIELAYYSKSDGWILEMWPMAKDPKISHWMPLPALPSVEEPQWKDAMMRTFLGNE